MSYVIASCALRNKTAARFGPPLWFPPRAIRLYEQDPGEPDDSEIIGAVFVQVYKADYCP